MFGGRLMAMLSVTIMEFTRRRSLLIGLKNRSVSIRVNILRRAGSWLPAAMRGARLIRARRCEVNCYNTKQGDEMSRATAKERAYRNRVMMRLRESNYSNTEIAEIFGVSRQCIHISIGAGSKFTDKSRDNMRGRVMSRLMAAPYRLGLREMQAVWGVSMGRCCVIINKARYGERRVA